MANRKLIVEVIGDSKSLERSFARSTKASQQFATGTTGALGKVDSAFSKTQKVVAGGFVGGLVAQQAVTAIKSVVSAAAESQQVLGQTKVALEATGKSWEQYGKQIESTVQQQSKLGFDDEALLRTFSLFQRSTGDVSQALKENNLAMDVARARFIDLEQAAQLVNKAALGQAGALRRLGIDTKGATSGTELLTLLTEKYGGAAKAASTDATTALDRVQVSTENLKESIGTVLLPAVKLLADDLAVVADNAALAVDGLRKLGDVRIPEITIPFNITIGGNRVSDLAGDAAHFAKFTPLNPLFGLTIANAIANQFRDQADAATPTLANDFARTINTLTSNALDTAASQTKVEPPKVKGFGSGLKPEDLFGPKITGIPKALQERLLDAEIAGKGIRETLVKQRDILVNALDDPRNNRDDRIKIKTALKSVKDSIAAIDEQVAADSKAASDARTSRLNKIADDAKTAAEKHKAKLKEIAEHRAQLARDAAEAARAALQAGQFRALGLSGTGDRPPPGIENLRKQLVRLSKRDDLTSADKGILARIRKVLVDPIHKATPETRNAIKGLFDGIRQEFDRGTKTATGPLTKTSSLNTNKILDGLGLGRDMEKELRARLSSFNSAGVALAGARRPSGGFGSQPVVVESHTTVTLDGEVVGRNVTRSQQKAARRNPPQRRGPNVPHGI